MKKYIEFQLDNGESLLVEVDEDSVPSERIRSASEETAITKAERGFSSAMSSIRVAADSILTALRELNQPDDITLEFGVKFGAKAGAILASADSEATLRVTLKWSKTPAS